MANNISTSPQPFPHDIQAVNTTILSSETLQAMRSHARHSRPCRPIDPNARRNTPSPIRSYTLSTSLVLSQPINSLSLHFNNKSLPNRLRRTTPQNDPATPPSDSFEPPATATSAPTSSKGSSRPCARHVSSHHYCVHLTSVMPLDASPSMPSGRHYYDLNATSTDTHAVTLPHQSRLLCGSGGSASTEPSIARKAPPSLRRSPNFAAPRRVLSGVPLVHPLTAPTYVFMGMIGQGTYGRVLLGYRNDGQDRRLHAVKVVSKFNFKGPGLSEVVRELGALRFIAQTMASRDADVGAQCSMKRDGVQFLQRLIESFQDEDNVFIVLEYHPTTLLNSEVAKRFRLSPAEPLTGLSVSVSLPSILPTREARASRALLLLSAEITSGLLFLHRHGIVHQDIKPANVLISSQGHAVVGDFGAATQLPLASSSNETPSHDECVYGPIVLHPGDMVTFTPLYAAPEMSMRNMDGLLLYDYRVDWWSLGILLHELATGAVPFRVTEDQLTPLRRSEGDAGGSFALLDRLSPPMCTAAHVDDERNYLNEFIKELLIVAPERRLSGANVLNHKYFEPLQGDWAEVMGMNHPPCPHPPTAPAQISLTNAQGTCPTKPESLKYRADQSLRATQQRGVDRLQHETHECLGIIEDSGLGFVPILPDKRMAIGSYDDSLDGSFIEGLPSSASFRYLSHGIEEKHPEREQHKEKAHVMSRPEFNDSGLFIPYDTSASVPGVLVSREFYDQLEASLDQDGIQIEHLRRPRRAHTEGLPVTSSSIFRSSRHRFPPELKSLQEVIVSPLKAHPKARGVPVKPEAVSWTLEEKITLAILEAMALRDSQGERSAIEPSYSGPWIGTRSRHQFRFPLRKLWRKLVFW